MAASSARRVPATKKPYGSKLCFASPSGARNEIAFAAPIAGANTLRPHAAGAHCSRDADLNRQRVLPVQARDHETEAPMLNAKSLDELAARIGKAFEGSPAKDLEKNVKAMLQSGLARLDLVTRQEFDIQADVLRKTREKVERLETRVAELEARMPPAPPTLV